MSQPQQSTQLVKWEQNLPSAIEAVKAHIATLTSLSELTDFRNQLDALRSYAGKSGAARATTNTIVQARLIAEARAGEILQNMELRPGPKGARRTNANSDAGTWGPKLSELLGGTDESARKRSSWWQELAKAIRKGLDLEGIATDFTAEDKDLTAKLVYARAHEIVKGTARSPMTAVKAWQAAKHATAALITALMWLQDNGAKPGEALRLARQIDGLFRAERKKGK